MAQQQFPPAGTERFLNGERYVSDGAQFVKQAAPSEQVGVPGQIAKAIKRLPAPMMVPEPIADMARATVASPFEFAENPNWETGLALGANVASMFPMGRAAKVAAPAVRSGMQTLKQVLGSAARSAVGGAVGGAIDASQQGSDPGIGAVTGAVRQGGADLVGGGVLAGLGGGLRTLGRNFAYRAIDPSNADLAALHMAYRDTPQGFRTLPAPFIPSKSRTLLKDILEGETLSGQAVGGVGGERSAVDAILRADISDALKDNVLNKTVQRTGPLTVSPKAEYAVNIEDIANQARQRIQPMGGPGGGLAPQQAREAATSQIDRFLQRDPDARAFASSRPLLPEPSVPVPLAGAAPFVEQAPVVGTGPIVPVRREAPLRAGGNPDVTTPRSGDRAFQTPQMTLRPPVAETQYPSGGTMMRPQSEANRLAGVVAENSAAHPYVGLDTATNILKNVDRDLAGEMQSRVGAMGRSEAYVPSPSETAGMEIRGALRQAINEKAPMGSDLYGQPKSLADILRDHQREIVMRDLKVQATGDDLGALRGRMGINPQTQRPNVSLFENISRFGGGLANPLMSGAQSTLSFAPNAPSLARLAAMLGLAERQEP